MICMVTRFKSESQRKAVMSALNKPHTKSIKYIPKSNMVDFPIDLVQAEFMNEDTEISNVWKWKKGQNLTRWMDGWMRGGYS